jgi:hypothetical protein
VLTQSTAGHEAGPTSDLELVNYGAGHAWLRPKLDAAIRDADRLDQDLGRLLDRRGAESPEPRYWITDEGRRALDEDRRACAMEALFGRPWSTVAEASTLEGAA